MIKKKLELFAVLGRRPEGLNDKSIVDLHIKINIMEFDATSKYGSLFKNHEFELV